MEKIKIENLSFSYDKKNEAIKNLDLTIKSGKWIAVVGHNGSGKSTLAKLLVGLLVPDKGSIYIDGLLMNEEN
ncbi:MAG: ATP-binding cassette domain-containing protein, partial [Candidatus ainarchaeum sp.]|nr:ATP-binding cassette domain-containing protein [Candidatus ainarchaeum sp.]